MYLMMAQVASPLRRECSGKKDSETNDVGRLPSCRFPTVFEVDCAYWSGLMRMFYCFNGVCRRCSSRFPLAAEELSSTLPTAVDASYPYPNYYSTKISTARAVAKFVPVYRKSGAGRPPQIRDAIRRRDKKAGRGEEFPSLRPAPATFNSVSLERRLSSLAAAPCRSS